MSQGHLDAWRPELPRLTAWIALTVLPLTLAATAILAEPPAAPEAPRSSEVRAWLGAGTWPVSASIPLDTTPVTKPERYRDIHRQDYGHGDAWAGRPERRPATPASIAPTGAASGPGPSGERERAAEAAAHARRQEELARIERELRNAQGRMLELEESAKSYVQLASGTQRRELLRPLLMFLVERGVLGDAEVEPLLSAPDPTRVLDRIRSAVEAVRRGRDALQVRRYLLGG